ncbi:MAG TPA: NAD-dependent epimerase/dehydratase family protein, partial [Candidatus Babeliales bacterium]|nr:NAD-dependent epimerase/dehydratase family protein [Candidatus Babeliales bacterium]
MKYVLYFNTRILITIILIFSLQKNIVLKADVISEYLTQYYQEVPVLVTGGCGFIGSHLVEQLVALGAKVSILDDLSTGNENNIVTVQDKVTLIRGSITNLETCLHATHNQKIIFHLAAFVSVPGSMENPHICHEINVVGTSNLLEAARINGIKRFVFSSTCATYGENSARCNEVTPTHPTSPYGFSKLMGEIYCKEYAQAFDIETVAMRYFNVYGPRQNPQASYAGVIAKFMYNMEHNLPLTIFGDGTQTRDYVPVEKVVTANLLLGMCEKKYVQAQLFNIATGKSSDLFDIIDLLKQKYPTYNNDIIFMSPRQGDVLHVAADFSKY